MREVSRGVMLDVEWRSLAGHIFVGVCLFVLALVCIVVLFPFLFSFTAGLKTNLEFHRPGINPFPETAHWANYVDVWQRFNLVGTFRNTFIVAGGGALVQLAVSTLAAYSLSRLKPVGGNVIRAILLATLAVPSIAYIVPLYVTLTDLPFLGVSLINTFLGLWIAAAPNALQILILKSSFDAIPQEIFDAASVDGASALRQFRTFMVPLSRSILVVLGSLAFVGLWGQFLLPYLILRDPSMQTVSVRLVNMTRDFPMNIQLAASFISMVPPTIVAIFMQRYQRHGEGLTF